MLEVAGDLREAVCREKRGKKIGVRLPVNSSSNAGSDVFWLPT